MTRPPARGATRKPAASTRQPRTPAGGRRGATPNRRTPERPPVTIRWKWLIVALVAAALLVGLVRWLMRDEPATAPAETPPASTSVETAPASTTAPADATPEPAPRAVDDLQFYEILPEQTILPDTPRAQSDPNPRALTPVGQQFWLMVGTFQQESLAVFRQDRLATQGLPARVDMDGRDDAVRYRVIAGPFPTAAAQAAAQATISALGYPAKPIDYAGVQP